MIFNQCLINGYSRPHTRIFRQNVRPTPIIFQMSKKKIKKISIKLNFDFLIKVLLLGYT